MGDWSDKLDYEYREYYGHFYDPDREEDTEEESVEILKEMAFTATETQRRALEDAISALSTEGDLISKQAVDDVMYDYSRYHDLNYAQIMEYINKLPSVENKGEWIYDGDCYICNQCKSVFNWWADSQTSNYCPNCGAKMKGGE